MRAASRPSPDRPARHLWSRAGRRWLWRARYLVVAVCCGIAATSAVQILAPAPPPTRDVVVTARHVAAGTELQSADVEVRAVPSALVPADAVSDPDDVVGRVPAVGLAAGLPLSAELVAGGDLAALAPPGSVVVPVRLDGATAALLRPGDHVDLVATTPESPDYLARRALVLPSGARASSDGGAGAGLLGSAGGGSSEGALTLLAVSDDEAPGLSAASSAGEIAAVLVP